MFLTHVTYLYLVFIENSLFSRIIFMACSESRQKVINLVIKFEGPE